MSEILRRARRPAAVSVSWLAMASSAIALLASPQALAAEIAAPSEGGGGNTAEGAQVSELIVTAERNKAAATAPTKGSITETQPESIISRQYIEQVTPETGDYTTTVLIAPSLSGISSNGGGVGETNKISLRGFKDGQYNITYDGIFYGDTNDPTHHPASFFPASTIGAAVVDRGPGAAGDLGQANYGGAIHFFSPEVSDTFTARQKATYGSFNTRSFVTTLNSGAISQLGGAKVLVNLDERLSDGELSWSSGKAFNELLKISAPLGDKATLTLFGAYNYTRFYQSDAGPGETWAQVLAYGKNFALNNIPTDEHYYKDNFQAKRSDFEYADVRGDLGHGLNAEDQAYTYFYSNKTISVNDVTGLVGGPNTDAPANKALPRTDLGGYDKGNRYRVFGNILRLNQDLSFGTLKTGALIETSSTDRHNLLLDLTQGIPDLKYSSLTTPAVKNVSNVKTLEDSSWFQYQLFADFVWRPTDSLTITPGFKYVHLKRSVDAAMENSGVTNFKRGPVKGSNTYTKPLYFLTANYRIQPDWSVYAQYATGFLIPALSTLQVNNLSLNALKPQETTNYQAGTVYTHGRVTADFDGYLIEVKNLAIPDPTGQFYINAGNARYDGVEGEAAYAFDMGLTLFANGSVNNAVNKDLHQDLTNVPEWTLAAGALYYMGPWQASVTFKQVGKQTVYFAGATPLTTPDGVSVAANQARKLGAYTTTDASISYDFGRFKLKLAGYNLFDHRAITSITGPSAADLYTFQAGRQIQGTIEAKF